LTKVAKTTDGGRTWSTQTLEDYAGWAKGLDCKDANTCFFGGNYAKLVRTTDGGSTWSKALIQPFNNGTYSGYLHALTLTGQGNSLLAGATCYDPDTPGTANFTRSLDGLAAPGFSATGLAATNHYYCPVMGDIACPTPGVCYAAPSNAQVIRTTDNGDTWTYIPAQYWVREEWYGISCVDRDSCWAAGARKTKIGTDPSGEGIYRKDAIIEYTQDGGNNWYYQAVDVANVRFWDVKMFDRTHGYAVGCEANSYDYADRCINGRGVVYRTDNGVSWTRMADFGAAELMGVEVRGLDDIFVVDFAGSIWHYFVEPTPTPSPTVTLTPTATLTPTPADGRVEGLVFSDLNGNLLAEDGEPGLSNATLALDQGATESYTATSGANGEFAFDHVAPGQYTLAQKTAPAGYELNANLSTFRVLANATVRFYIAQYGLPLETATSTTTPTETPASTATATATWTAAATATVTPTGSTTPKPITLHLPLLLQD
jgi:photosystem II stability/assembly factor-like uncharacterized protein